MTGNGGLRNIGWVVVLALCICALSVMTFSVNAVKSEVRLAEREIVALTHETILLETDFQSRANQQQLADWNRIDFGYRAPTADQYLENERQLASLGLPRGHDAPDPIRVARASGQGSAEVGLRSLLSPITGAPFEGALAQKVADEVEQDPEDDTAAPPRQSLSDRLGLSSPLGGQFGEVSE